MKRTTVFLSYLLDTDTPVYGNDGGFKRKSIRCIDCGDTSNNEFWELTNHTGTHMDFPYHFLADGQKLQEFDAAFFQLTNVFTIVLENTEPAFVFTKEALAHIHFPPETQAIILKTGFGKHRGTETYWNFNPGYHTDLADFFREKCPDIRFFGFDTISLSSFQNRPLGREAHKSFLKKSHPILIIEDMDLSSISDNTKITHITIAPVLVKDADGAPVTIFATIESTNA